MSACRPRRGTRGGGTRAGGDAVAGTIAFRSGRGIPVVVHVGLTPQAVNALGGYRARGRDEAEAAKGLADPPAGGAAGRPLALAAHGVRARAAGGGGPGGGPTRVRWPRRAPSCWCWKG